MNQTFTIFTSRKRLFGMVALALLLFAGNTVFAQVTTSTISGLVADAAGDGLPGATVVATHVPSGTRYGAATNAAGRYVLPAVRVGGPFRVEVSYTGYDTQVRENVYTSLGTATDLKFYLKESAAVLDEAVIVAARNDVFSSDRTGAAYTLDNRAIQEVPIIGSRSISEVTKYTPFGNGRSFGGQDNRLNNFTVDGSQFNNGFGLGSETPAGGRTNSTAISLDAIEEVQVNVAPFDVRQSGFIGAGMNAVTRSGNNDYEGSVYTFWRNNSNLFNGTRVNGREVTVGKFNERILGARLGGALVKDKLFFFANYERVRRVEPAQNWFANGSPNAKEGDLIARPTYQTMTDLSNFVRQNFGYETGAFENYDDETNSDKFLIRLDYNINPRHRLMLRYTHHDSDDYVLISNSSSLGFGNRRTNANSMSYRNSGYLIEDNTRSIVGEWNWTINERLHNSFIVGYDKQIENRGYAGAFFPTVDILQNNINLVSFGMDPFTPDNSLDYGTFHVTNNLSYYAGRHTITGGINYEYFKSNNLFFPGSNGVYVFNSLDDFYAAANSYIANPTLDTMPVAANRVQFRYSALPGGAKPWQTLETHRIDPYIQDNIKVRDNFSLLVGLRAAIIAFKNTALENPVISAQDYIDIDEQRGYKINTGRMPKLQFLFEPRLGFNWDVYNDRRTQLRGGTGIFTGRPPYVWLSNQIGNNGILTGFDDVRNSRAYPFNPNAGTAFVPDNPTLPSTFDIAATDPNYKFPQVWKSNLAMDQRLGRNLIVTGELLLNKDVNAMSYFNANMEPATGTFEGTDGRDRFPGSFVTGSAVAPAARINDNVANAIVLNNTNKGYYFGATLMMDYAPQSGFFGRAGYTYSRARNLFDAGSIAAGSWQGNATVNGNNNAVLAWANNFIPHRIFGLVGYRIEYGGKWGGATGISIGYDGQQSGRVSFTASGDLNGDNVFNNDLIYVPNSASELQFEQFTAGGKTFTAADQIAAFDAFINQDPYLSGRRGRYAQRNGGTFPWLHRFDLSITQDVFVRTGRDGRNRNGLQFRVDILNFGNMLNDAWGVGNALVGAQPLSFRGVTNNAPRYRMNTQVIDGETVLLQNTFVKSTSVANVWTAQFGLRYTFGL
jgi:hypothetical protein